MFELISEDGSARVGKLKTGHGTVDTPAFMPVATKASVKTLSPEELRQINTQAIISNAFVLSLRPGTDIIKQAGGLHRFMNWDGCIFTDSGGFQMIRKDFLIKVEDKGITFRSPYDGKKILFTPEMCAEIQSNLGSDVAMVLDDCPPYESDYDYVKESLERTIDWARRFKEKRNNEKQMVFAITQGGVFEDLRRESIEALENIGFHGYGIGGLSIGEPKEVMFRVLKKHTPMLPKNKPRYLMGVGSPEDLLDCISLGVDIFDSVFPTRNARHKTAFTKDGKINLGKAGFDGDLGPLDKDCGCYACMNYKRAYINHLLREHEVFGWRLVTLHNIHFLQELLKDAREAVSKGTLQEFKEGFKKRYASPPAGPDEAE